MPDANQDLQPEQDRTVPVETSVAQVQDAEQQPENEEQQVRKLSPTKALTEFQLEQEEAAKSSRISLDKLLQTYFIPLIVIAVFGAVIFLLILPAASRIFNQLSLTNSTYDDVATVQQRLTRLQQLSADRAQIEQDIQAIERVVPQGSTEVVNFQQEVKRIAHNENGLTVVEASTGERLLRTTSDSNLSSEDQESALSIWEIPTTFAVTGTLPQIKSFIDDIKTINDFVIIGEMQLRTDQEFDANQLNAVDGGQWRLAITLTKYQFQLPTQSNRLSDIYLSVPESSPISTRVMEYIRGKTN